MQFMQFVPPGVPNRIPVIENHELHFLVVQRLQRARLDVPAQTVLRHAELMHRRVHERVTMRLAAPDDASWGAEEQDVLAIP